MGVTLKPRTIALNTRLTKEQNKGIHPRMCAHSRLHADTEASAPTAEVDRINATEDGGRRAVRSPSYTPIGGEDCGELVFPPSMALCAIQRRRVIRLSQKEAYGEVWPASLPVPGSAPPPRPLPALRVAALKTNSRKLKSWLPFRCTAFIQFREISRSRAHRGGVVHLADMRGH